MKRIVSLALVLVMVAALFAGCAASEPKVSDQEALVGTWKGEMDLTKALKEEIGDELEGFEMDEFKVTVVFKFAQDGTYTKELDEASVETAFEGLIAGMEGFMKTLLEAQAQEAGMSLDEMLAAAGMTMEDMMSLVTAAFEEQDLTGELLEDAKTEGKYKAEAGKLYMTDEKDEEINEDIYDTYTLEGDVLTLTATFGGNEEDNDMMKSVYPIVLKKAA